MHHAEIMFDYGISFAQRGHFQAYRLKGVSPILLLSVSRSDRPHHGSVPGTFTNNCDRRNHYPNQPHPGNCKAKSQAYAAL